MLRFVLVFVLLATSVVSATAVVGGKTGEHRAQQHTVFLTSNRQDCSGTLIARDLVLTAAHCVSSGENYRVSTSAGYIRVLEVVIHPAFRRDSYETHKPSGTVPDFVTFNVVSAM